MSLRIDQIRRDGGTQSRAAINEATVAEYAEMMLDPIRVFPPVIVYHDGRDYWLADGFHRLAAWERIGRTDIPTDIRQGTRRDAILHSVAANSTHGLRRTNEDKRRAVMTLLDDAEWSQWSDGKIADRCGVSQPFVSSIRRDLSQNGFDVPAVRTVERGGTTYQQDTARIGKRPAETAAPASEELGPAPQEIKAEAVVPVPEEIDPEVAKARRELARLTTDALIDEVIGLRADLADEKARRKAVTAERDAMKARLADYTADDKDAVISRLQKSVEHERSRAWRATEEQGAAMKQVHALKKRVAELESMGIAL
mgnify:CR=1 FL=1